MNIMQMLMNQLKMRNPQTYQKFQHLQKSQNDPKKLINQMTSNYTPEQMKSFIEFANGFGITNEQLNNFGIKEK